MNKHTPLKWDTTQHEDQLLTESIHRLHALPGEHKNRGRVGLVMDLTVVHRNGTPLDFEKLLISSELDFLHDIYGIREHLDRETGTLRNNFVPYCKENTDA